jgi:hypothetical protein
VPCIYRYLRDVEDSKTIIVLVIHGKERPMAMTLKRWREKSREWRAAHPDEKPKKAKKRSTAKARKHAREYMRRWRAADPEKAREYERKYRAAHPEKCREWKAANPERVREHWRRSNAKTRAVAALRKDAETGDLKCARF